MYESFISNFNEQINLEIIKSMSQLFSQEQNVMRQNPDTQSRFNSSQSHHEKHNNNSRRSNDKKSVKENALFHNEEESKKAKFMIKINKNIENALPSNFFSNPITSKSGNAKKYYPSTEKNQLKLSLETKNNYNTQVQQTQLAKIKMIQRYQSIQFSPVSEAVILKYSDVGTTCRFRSTRSLQTSIERNQNEINESYETGKEEENDCNVLPKTAETIDNLDDDDLFNVTFGNGWKKNTRDVTQSKHQSSVIYSKHNPNQSKIFRLRNVQSLELKKPCLKSFHKKEGIHAIITDTISEKEGVISRNERKSITQFKKQRVIKMYSDHNGSVQNPFLKNKKLNMEEIVKKKTLMLPKMKSPLGDLTKKEKLNKLMKLVF